MKMNGGEWRKWEKCFRLAFPQNLYKSGTIWPGLTSRHLLQGKKHGELTHPPFSNNKGGADAFIEWESMETLEKWEKCFAAIPTKPDQI